MNMEKENKIFNQVGNKNSFNVPENYFEDFAKNMEKMIDEQEAIDTHIQLSMWQKLQPYLYLAAMFIGLYISINLFFKPSQSKIEEKKQMAELITQQEIILDEIDEFTLYEMISYLN